MIISRNSLTQNEKQEWDNFNLLNNCNSIYQSSLWMDYLEATGIDFKCLRHIRGNNEIVSQLLYWSEPPNIIYKLRSQKLINKIINICFARKIWKDGPTMNQQIESQKEKEVTLFVKTIKPKKILSGICSSLIFNENQTKIYNLKNEKYGTFVINTNQNIIELSKKIHSSVKKNLKKINNLKIKILLKEENYLYYNLLKQFRAKINKSPPYHPINNFLFEVINKRGFCKYIAAFDGDNIVGGLGLLGWANCLIEIGVARDLCHPVNSVAQDFIKWYIIENAKSWGFREYDLAGFNPADNSEKGINIKRFKKKWGGDEKIVTHLRP